MGTLTVRENIMFSANLRLSSSVTKQEKRTRVNDVIEELRLTSCADSKVINELLLFIIIFTFASKLSADFQCSI